MLDETDYVYAFHLDLLVILMICHVADAAKKRHIEMRSLVNGIHIVVADAILHQPLLTQCHYCPSPLYCYASSVDDLDGNSFADSICRLPSDPNEVGQRSSNANAHNIAGSVADDPNSSLIEDVPNNPGRAKQFRWSKWIQHLATIAM